MATRLWFFILRWECFNRIYVFLVRLRIGCNELLTTVVTINSSAPQASKTFSRSLKARNMSTNAHMHSSFYDVPNSFERCVKTSGLFMTRSKPRGSGWVYHSVVSVGVHGNFHRRWFHGDFRETFRYVHASYLHGSFHVHQWKIR